MNLPLFMHIGDAVHSAQAKLRYKFQAKVENTDSCQVTNICKSDRYLRRSTVREATSLFMCSTFSG